DRDDKGGPFSRLAPDIDGASMPEHDAAADGEPDSGSLVILRGMQALEGHEDALGILLIESDSVVGHFDLAEGATFACATRTRLRRHVHNGRGVGPVELERVSDKVLEELPHLERVCCNGGQLIDLHRSVHVLNANFEVREYAGYDVIEI